MFAKMKFTSILLLLVASVSARVPNDRDATSSTAITRREELVSLQSLKATIIEEDSKPERGNKTSKRQNDTAYTAYITQYPNNQVPDFVVCANANGGNAVMYSQDDIIRALQTGWGYINARTPRHLLPSFAMRTTPHYLTGNDDELQGVYTGDGSWVYGETYEFPILPSTVDGSPWNGGRDWGLDRVVFDRRGDYMGVVTHRGLTYNGLHWAQPTDIRGQVRRFPGVPGYGDLRRYPYVAPGAFMYHWQQYPE